MLLQVRQIELRDYLLLFNRSFLSVTSKNFIEYLVKKRNVSWGRGIVTVLQLVFCNILNYQ